MITIKRAAVAAPAVVAVAAPAAPTATAAPAYRCASSTHDIDDTSYGGPWPDNWRVTVKTCAARRGATVMMIVTPRMREPVPWPSMRIVAQMVLPS